jgi:hypothetical protein
LYIVDFAESIIRGYNPDSPAPKHGGCHGEEGKEGEEGEEKGEEEVATGGYAAQGALGKSPGPLII